MDRPARHFYEFDSFRVDVEERQLLQNGTPVQLTPKVFDILLALVENSGHTLGKDDLMRKVWADSFVEEGNLNRNVSTLRKLLGDDSHEPRFIKTAPKRGYRFVGDVHEIWQDEDVLKVENRGRYRVQIRKEVITESTTYMRLAVGVSILIVIGAAVSIWMWRSAGKNESRAASVEAAELYEKARALWQTRDGANLQEATVNLEQLVQKYPDFAFARAALADCYAFDYSNWKRAETEARKAILIDPNIGEPHATIGFVKMFWEWRLEEAEAEFKEAIRLSPNYATAHQWYSVLLTATDRQNAAYAEMQMAAQLAPDSQSIAADLCGTLYFQRRYPEAEAQCRKTLEINDNFYNAHIYLYEIYNAAGKYDDAFAEHLKIEELAGVKVSPEINEKLRKAFESGGIRAFWRARIEQFERGNVPESYLIAQNYARLGEKENALKWLRDALEGRDLRLLMLLADPVFDDLRGEARFDELMPFMPPPGK